MDKTISSFFSDDGLRRAEVNRDEYHFVVWMHYKKHKNDTWNLYRTELISNHTLQYAEDLAENYVDGVGPFKELDL